MLGAAIAQSRAGSELELGVEAYKNARFEHAIQHFEKAVWNDPRDVRARLYLATAYSTQYIPGADTPENQSLAESAIQQYEKVLEIDSLNLDALKGLAYLTLQMKKYDRSKELYRRVIEIDPKDAEAYYTVGVIDWTQSYQPRMEVRAKLGLKPEQSMILRAECWQVRRTTEELVDDGIQNLKSALELKPDYDDAMAYMNLMYRERADTQCNDAGANARDLKAADAWVDLTLATKKNKAQREERLHPSDQPETQ